LVSVFERNVDPFTGDRAATARARAAIPTTIRARQRAASASPSRRRIRRRRDARNHHANQQLFTTICAATLSQSICAAGLRFNIWNSIQIADPSNGASPRLSMAFSAMLAGQGRENNPNPGPFAALSGKILLFQLGRFPTMAGGLSSISAPALTFRDEDDMPLVPLVVDPGDSLAPAIEDAWFAQRVIARGGAVPDPLWNLWRSVGIAGRLDDEQEALIGCGRFWGTHCDVDGFDLFNAEASVLFQSWPGFEGTGGRVAHDRQHPRAAGHEQLRRRRPRLYPLQNGTTFRCPAAWRDGAVGAQNNPAVTPRANGAPGRRPPRSCRGIP
jgi:hypothetical protein